MQIQPDIQELVHAQAWNIVDLELVCLQILLPDIVITLERRYSPPKGPVGKYLPGRFMVNADIGQ